MWIENKAFSCNKRAQPRKQNIEITTTLCWWSSVPIAVLIALLFPKFSFTFFFRSLSFKHSYNAEIDFQITNDYFKISKAGFQLTFQSCIVKSHVMKISLV